MVDRASLLSRLKSPLLLLPGLTDELDKGLTRRYSYMQASLKNVEVLMEGPPG